MCHLYSDALMLHKSVRAMGIPTLASSEPDCALSTAPLGHSVSKPHYFLVFYG